MHIQKTLRELLSMFREAQPKINKNNKSSAPLVDKGKDMVKDKKKPKKKKSSTTPTRRVKRLKLIIAQRMWFTFITTRKGVGSATRRNDPLTKPFSQLQHETFTRPSSLKDMASWLECKWEILSKWNVFGNSSMEREAIRDDIAHLEDVIRFLPTNLDVEKIGYGRERVSTIVGEVSATKQIKSINHVFPRKLTFNQSVHFRETTNRTRTH
ncbi:unnamed protein product [Dovyalis caffra]|uniref:Ribosomal protein S3 n=1 Tax=Dovyalis caffra TaxID=77055 RepID=A0AAV1RDJ6_9ROSI|nr:unnamed protein product [Dovyalis caffra]